MKKITPFLLSVILLGLSAGMYAQNLFNDDFAQCNGELADAWTAIHKKDASLADAVFVADPIDASNTCLKLSHVTGGQAKVNGLGSKFDLKAGTAYILKFDRYVGAATTSTGDKIMMNVSTQIKPNKTYSPADHDKWITTEFEITVTDDMTDVAIAIQLNPGDLAEVYFDNFSLEAQADKNDVTINVERPEGIVGKGNIWVTLAGQSKMMKLGTADSTSVMFSLDSIGTYDYALLGSEVHPIFGSLVVTGDQEENFTMVLDPVNVGSLTLYPSVALGELPADTLGERVVAETTLYRDSAIIFNGSAIGFWPGNLNAAGLDSAGAIISYCTTYGDKVKKGWINPTPDASANGILFEYFDFYKAGIIVKNADGEYVEALVTITETSIVADTLKAGIYAAELKNDGTTYNFSVSAAGYNDTTGTIMQADAAMLEDVIVNVVMEKEAVSSLKSIKQNVLNVYPNPASDRIFVTTAERGSLEIYSLSGALLQSVPLLSLKNELSVSAFEKGIYFVRFRGETASPMIKVLID